MEYIRMSDTDGKEVGRLIWNDKQHKIDVQPDTAVSKQIVSEMIRNFHLSGTQHQVFQAIPERMRSSSYLVFSNIIVSPED